jgi:hypothetical protein
MMAYFGELVKMCANISYIMMTLNRYLLVGKDHAKWLISIAKLDFKRVIRASLLISVLLNIGHGWEYQAVEDLAVLRPFLASDSYLIISGYSNSDYPEGNQEKSYYFYSIVYFAINFGVFFILNTGIEVKIVRRMHKELNKKRERLAKMSGSNISQLADEKKVEEDLKKERRVIKMVVLNGFFNFVFRAPDMLFWMENEDSWTLLFTDQNGFIFTTLSQYMPGFLSFITDISYLAYIITFTTNFVIFYKFNSKFKEAFWTKNRLLCKK